MPTTNLKHTNSVFQFPLGLHRKKWRTTRFACFLFSYVFYSQISFIHMLRTNCVVQFLTRCVFHLNFILHAMAIVRSTESVGTTVAVVVIIAVVCLCDWRKKNMWTAVVGVVGLTVLCIYLTSLTWRPGGSDCFNLSAFSLSATTNVYKKREHRILNLVFNGFFLILTARASFRRALIKKSFTSLISFGIFYSIRIQPKVQQQQNSTAHRTGRMVPRNNNVCFVCAHERQ